VIVGGRIAKIKRADELGWEFFFFFFISLFFL
jgi:hypothetical protein